MDLGIGLSLRDLSVRGDPTLTLHQNFLLNSGSTIAQVAVIGPVLIFTRASSGTNFNESATLVTATNDNPRFDHDPANGNAALGLLIEEARTNEALHAADLTNAAWVKTNTTAAKDATGLDNVANSASTLTASANNGTCFQTVTKASAENTYSASVRRKTGSGTVEITDDGGTIFTDITASINSSAYVRFNLTRTQANPQFGFRLGTSGDEIEVDGNQLEAGAFPTSYIPTTTASATRVADGCTTTDVSWFNDLAGTFYSRSSLPVFGSSNVYPWALTETSGGNDIIAPRHISSGNMSVQHSTSVGSDGNVNPSGTISEGVLHKIAFAFDSFNIAATLNGGTVGTDSSITVPTADPMAKLWIGRQLTVASIWNGHVAERKYWNVRKPDAFLQSETT